MIGTPELILILVMVLFVFSPNKIPEMARSLGKAAGEFKAAQLEARNEPKKLDTPLDNKDTSIRNFAIGMGINVENKMSEQLIEEIRSKIKSNDVVIENIK